MSKYVFDDFYADYDSWYQTPMGAFVDRVETDCALGLLEPAAGQSVLDAGCGTGNFSLKLAEMGCRVTAVDVAEKMMDQARQKAVRAGADIRFLREDMAELPFGDGSFDRVLTMAAFEFLPDPARAVRELLRVLRPGGVLVIGTIEKGGPWAGLYESDAMAGTAYERASFLTGESIAAMARRPSKRWSAASLWPPAPRKETSPRRARQPPKPPVREEGLYACASGKSDPLLPGELLSTWPGGLPRPH